MNAIKAEHISFCAVRLPRFKAFPGWTAGHPAKVRDMREPNRGKIVGFYATFADAQRGATLRNRHAT